MIDVTVPLLTPDQRAVAYLAELQTIYTQKNYAAQEASVCLPGDKTMLKAIEQVREVVGSHIKAAIVIGIGGSNLGTKALYEAGVGATLPLFFLDTCDAWTMDAVLVSIQKLGITTWSELAVVCVSKSGNTTETIANFSSLIPTLTTLLGPVVRSSIVIIADEGTNAQSFAQESGYSFLSIPSKVGGRYSVFSAVGLFPLLLAGVPIDTLRLGAQMQLEADCSTNSMAGLYASFLYSQLQQGKTIHDFFIFEPRLETLGKWLKQLYAESLGKDKKGMLPTVSMGSNDLHSVLQFYLGGNIQLVTTFIAAGDQSTHAASSVGASLVNGIEGKTLTTIKQTILEAVKNTYTQHSIAYASITLEDVRAQTLGAFLQFHMTTVMILGRLMEVNAFNQPDIQLYKKELHALLAQ